MADPTPNQGSDFDADLARLLQIKRAHASARPKPVENPAWFHTHNDLGFALGFIDNLWKAYSRADEERVKLQRLRPIESAAREAHDLLVKLIDAGEIDVVGTDIGADALRSRLAALKEALKQ